MGQTQAWAGLELWPIPISRWVKPRAGLEPRAPSWARAGLGPWPIAKYYLTLQINWGISKTYTKGSIVVLRKHSISLKIKGFSIAKNTSALFWSPEKNEWKHWLFAEKKIFCLNEDPNIKKVIGWKKTICSMSTYILRVQSSLRIFLQNYLCKCKDTYSIRWNYYLHIYEDTFVQRYLEMIAHIVLHWHLIGIFI